MTAERSSQERRPADEEERVPTRDGGHRSRAGSTYGDYSPPPGRERSHEANPMGDCYTGGAAGAGRDTDDAGIEDAAPVIPSEGDEQPPRSQEAGRADGSRRR